MSATIRQPTADITKHSPSSVVAFARENADKALAADPAADISPYLQVIGDNFSHLSRKARLDLTTWSARRLAPLFPHIHKRFGDMHAELCRRQGKTQPPVGWRSRVPLRKAAIGLLATSMLAAAKIGVVTYEIFARNPAILAAKKSAALEAPSPASREESALLHATSVDDMDKCLTLYTRTPRVDNAEAGVNSTACFAATHGDRRFYVFTMGSFPEADGLGVEIPFLREGSEAARILLHTSDHATGLVVDQRGQIIEGIDTGADGSTRPMPPAAFAPYRDLARKIAPLADSIQAENSRPTL